MISKGMYLKIVVLSVTVLLPPILNLSLKEEKQRVIVIGIDGFSTECIKDVPTIDWLKTQCSWTFRARTVFQAVSGPGWSSILCSLDPIDTGIVDNDWVPEWKGGNPKIHSISGKVPFKCIFENIKKNNPQKRTHYYYNWPFLSYFGNSSIGFVDQEISCNGDEKGYEECDRQVLLSTLDAIRQDNFEFLFAYFGNLDEIGHKSGFCDAEYSKEMSNMDGRVFDIVSQLRDQGIFESTTIIITSDHGATSHTKDHGTPDDQNILIPWIICGPGIKKGYEIESRVHNLDTSPTVSSIMGFEPHSSWVGRVVPDILESAREI